MLLLILDSKYIHFNSIEPCEYELDYKVLKNK